MTASPPEVREARDPYVRLLMWMLVPAAFFNGFDSELRALLLPQLQASFHVRLGVIGLANIPITLGAFAAFLLIRLSDRVGRRRVLLVSLFGYGLCSALTASATSILLFALFQMFTQLFIATEYALAVIVVAEEVEDDRRGGAIGRLLVAVPLGAVATALLQLAGLGHTALSWRAFYLVGVLPALAAVLFRKRLRETAAYGIARRSPTRGSVAAALSAPYRRRMLGLGLVSLLQKIPATAGAGYWVYYAETERHLSTTTVSIELVLAFGFGTIGYYVCGRAIDRFDRRPVVAVYLVLGALFGAALFQVSGEALSFVLLFFAVFFGLGIGPALSALSTESFPTAIRGTASSIVGNGFAGAGQLIGPAVVGVLGERGGLIGNVGDAVSLLTVLMVLALPALWALVSETNGIHLRSPVGP